MSASGADVVVIGGGIAGASAAWALAADHRVVLLELEAQPGTHATGRSAAVISETSGSLELCALAAASRPFLTDPPDDLDAPGVLSPRGLLWVADADHGHELDALAHTAATLGVRADLLATDAATALAPVLRPEWLAGALHEPDAMSIDVARLLDAFLDGVRRRGGEVRVSSPALRLAPTSSGWRVVTPELELDAAVVVNAAGAWADEVATRAGLEPLGLQVLRRTAFLFPWSAPDPSGWPLVMDAGSSFYFEPEGPGLLASPSEETPSPPCDARADELAMALAADALAAATTLVVRGVRHRWAGLRTFAPDRRPVVGFDPDAPGFFWLAGQGGAGIKTSPALAALTAALVDARPVPEELGRFGLDLARLAPDRLRRPPGAPTHET